MRPRPRLARPLVGLVLTLPGMVMGMVMGGVSAAPPRPPDPPMAEAEIGASVLVEEVQRIGMNLGIWTYWGAEQLARNILKNPGFEGIIDRALVRVEHAGRFRFNDDTARLAREDGFWSGASYEVLTGGGAGERGTLADSRAAGRGGLPELITTDAVGDLAPGDIIALTRIRDDLPPTHWWLPDAQNGRLWPDPNETPPASPGRRSLALSPFFGKTMRLSSHLDSIGERAGKLLPVAGRWRLALWVHGREGGETRLRILFRRHGSPPFLDLSLTPKPGWQRIERLLETQDAGPVGALELLVEVSGAGTLHLDDLWLGPWDPDRGSEGAEQRARETFRPEVIAALRELKPAWLRDWQGQLGDTLENRLAAPWARRATRYRPEGRGDFLYSLPEFLDLCVAVGANPWIILPTTFSDAEARELGAWLAGRIAADGFAEVLVEYGNENWNSVFRAAGIQDPDQHGAAADRVFAALRAGSGEHPAIRRAVGAQHANPWAVDKVARASSQSDVLAVAPYLLSRLGADDWVRALDLVFADDGGRLEQIARNLPSTGKELAVYEVNLHTTKGDATIDQRAAITTGAAAGPALAKRLLTAMGLGARRQCVWTLAGFDTKLNEGEGLVPLFGVARDLTRGDRLRPTGWAVAMLNRVIAGDLHPAKVGGAGADGLLVAPFRGPDGWSAAVVSALDEPRRLTLRFPSDASPRPAAALLLDASDPFKGNETTDQIRPRALALETIDSDRLALTIPPYSLAVLGPRECCHEP